MHAEAFDIERHAVLWEGLDFHARVVKDGDDITFGTHELLGPCVVQHPGLTSVFVWLTKQPVPDALFDEVEDAGKPITA